MKILRDYRVAGALYVNDTGVEAQVSDQVTLYLDQDAESSFPISIVATIQHPITKIECGSVTSYALEYNELHIVGARLLLRPHDIIDATVVSGVLVVATQLNVEIAARIADVNAEEAARIAADSAHEADTTAHPAANIVNTPAGGITAANAQAALNELDTLKAPKASPTFTGTVTLPSTTSIGTVTAAEIAFVSGVTAAIQPQINSKAPSASPSFAGVVTLGDAVDVVLNATIGTKIGTATTQKLAFHAATPVAQRAGATQAAAATTVGAAVVTTPATTGAFGFTQAQADSIPVRINSLIVDNAAQTALLNEIRAALVEKGLIKGAA